MWSKMSSAAVPATDRFAWFADVVATALAPTEIHRPHDADFRAEAAALALGPVQLSAFVCTPVQSRRTPAQIRQNDPEQYHFALITGCPMWMSQGRNDTELAAGDLALWDTAHPYGAGAREGGDPIRTVVVQLPRSALPLPADKVDRLLAQRISAETGMGAITAQFLRTLGTHGAACGPNDLNRLGRIALDLITACLAERCDTYDELPADARPRVLMEQIDAFIDHNLGDPGLTPQTIAARHHISVRRLHLMFQDREDSVAATIRRRRLERCHADLTRPELLTRPIHAIAARWGFSSAAVFSRAFREAYGISPSEQRACAGAVNRPDPGASA